MEQEEGGYFVEVVSSGNREVCCFLMRRRINGELGSALPPGVLDTQVRTHTCAHSTAVFTKEIRAVPVCTSA